MILEFIFQIKLARWKIMQSSNTHLSGSYSHIQEMENLAGNGTSDCTLDQFSDLLITYKKIVLLNDFTT